MFLISFLKEGFIFIFLQFLFKLRCKMHINYGLVIKNVETFDIRFPTSLDGDGSDAVHTDPDYSLCYVNFIVIFTKYLEILKSHKPL